MPTARIVKQLVCSECGQPLRRTPIPAAAVERTAPASDDDFDDDTIVYDQEAPVETVVERGPVCPRCAAYR